MEVVSLPVRQVFPDPSQPRKTFKEATLRELGATIKKRGQRQPINVERVGNGYQIIEGERRWRACILVGIPTIQAVVRERSNHNGRENLLSQMIENVQREDMNPVDEALAYQRLKDMHGMSVYEIAADIGTNSSRIYHCLKILELPEQIQEMIRDDRLSHDERVVDALLSIQNKKAMIGLAERAVSRRVKMTIPGIVDAVRRLNAAMGARHVAIGKDRSPALMIARRMMKSSTADEEQAPPKWNALKQLGKVPAWPVVVSSAKQTCERCELRDMANESTCGNCPLVNMLYDLVEGR